MKFEPRTEAIVIDSECPQLHKQKVILVKPNPRCTAEWEVLHLGKTWIVHTCRLREISTDIRTENGIVFTVTCRKVENGTNAEVV